VADLHQHRQRAPGRVLAQGAGQNGHPVQAVDVAVRLEAGIGGQPGDAALAQGKQRIGQARFAQGRPGAGLSATSGGSGRGYVISVSGFRYEMVRASGYLLFFRFS